MPQKKNPDVAELARGKSSRLIGNLVTVLTLLKGLPMTYNRDLQEDKEPLFDTVDTLFSTLLVFAEMIRAVQFNPEACIRAVSNPTLLATELADYLVKKGVSFREAHHTVGSAVKYAENKKIPLNTLGLSEWKRFHLKFDRDLWRVFELKHVFQSRDSLIGATGTRQVGAQLRFWKKRLQ